MSQGNRWIGQVMIPLSSLCGGLLATNEYNRVYEAVSRGTETQGKELVKAIVNALARASRDRRSTHE